MKQTSLRVPFTRSVSQSQLKQAMESSTKHRHVGKSHIPPTSSPEVVEFATNLTVLEGNVITSTVNGVILVFDHIRLGEILKIPTNGLVEYAWLTDENCLLTSKFSQEILPRGHTRHDACFRDLGVTHALEKMEPIDWPSLMIKHLARIVDPQPGSHQLTYGNLLPIMLRTFVCYWAKEEV
ncbi:hypothetical protein KY290_010894 [Solanum tuberosum]|uniref:Uncharacterized protein n=1 Tax=Solanum tuberosum TaxID=4113 RepID=A0ABQ7VZ24_SOLTU|nr:hypothetical protein KY290_010894 [Solanum tuberosum]